MIRRAVVSCVAVVMALAAGIALGGGPLSDLGGSPSQAAPPPAQPAPDPQAEARAAYAESFAADAAPGLYAGRLHGHPVALLTLPGADSDVVEALTAEVRAAGTRVISSYGLRRALVDPREKTLVDTLGLQLVEQLGDGAVTPEATTYDRIGQLVGRTVAASRRAAAMDGAKRSSLGASLHGAGLMTQAADQADEEPNVAPLVLVVTGKHVDQPVLSGIVAGLAAVARGVVVAGPTGDPGIASLRDQPPVRAVATVDGTDSAAGRAATVLTLVHVLKASGGAYGASGADGPIPLG